MTREVPPEHQYKGPAPDPFEPEGAVAVGDPPPPPAAFEEEAPPKKAIPQNGLPGFKKGQGNDQQRLGRIEAYLEELSPRLQMIILAVENMEIERRSSKELISYRCLGQLSNGDTCGVIIQGKRPEFRSYDERLVCPNHNGALTPMEPVLA